MKYGGAGGVAARLLIIYLQKASKVLDCLSGFSLLLEVLRAAQDSVLVGVSPSALAV